MKREPRSCRPAIAKAVAWPRRSAIRLPVGRVRSSPCHGSQASKTWCRIPVPRDSVRNSVRKPINARAGTRYSMRAQPVPWFTICCSLPLRSASSCVTTPMNSSGMSIATRSTGSSRLPSTSLVNTSGLPTVSSKPSRRISSMRIASCNSPRPCTSQASGRAVGRTRKETLPTSSASRRCLTWLAVSRVPSVPASGLVLIPIVTDKLGSSTVVTGSGRGLSGSAMVSPIVTSGSPASATISPGPASSAGTRSRASVMYSFVTRACSVVPSQRHHAIGAPLRNVPWRTRNSASRPTYGLASRFVTSACSGCSVSYSGAGIVSSSVVNKGPRSGASSSAASPARPARVRVHDRKLDLQAIRVEIEEQLVHLVHDLGRPRVAAIDLVDHEHDRQLQLQRLSQDEPRLRQRPLGRVDEQQHAVHHRQGALHLAAEVGVARRVDDVDPRVAERHCRVLGEDRDALLALEIHRVHHALGNVLVLAERAGLPEHRVDQRRLPVVDVRDDRDVPQVIAASEHD